MAGYNRLGPALTRAGVIVVVPGKRFTGCGKNMNLICGMGEGASHMG